MNKDKAFIHSALWTKEDLARAYPQIFRNGVTSVNYWIRLRKLPMVRFSKQGRIYFKPSEIERFIDENLIPPQENINNEE